MVRKQLKQADPSQAARRRGAVSAEENVYRQGLAKHHRGDLNGAEFIYRNILDRNPGHVGAWHYLGIISHARGRSEEALRYIEKSILLGPDKAVFYGNYGAVLMSAKRDQEAAIALGKALAIDPKHVNARDNLVRLRNGNAEGRTQTEPPEPSEQRIDRMLRRGSQLAVREQFVDANRVCHEAASLPGGRELWRWKSLGFCPTVFQNEQEIDRYWEKLDHGLDLALHTEQRMDWRTLPRDGFTPSFNLPHHDKNCREVKEKFARIFEKAFPQDPPDPKETRKDRTKIRVGFVVAAAHHLGFIRVNRALIKHLDPQKFEIFFFSETGAHAECRNRVGRDDIQWVGFGNRFDETVRRIRDARCDVVYHWKVGGSPLDYFLPFAKLAPVQCTSFGSHGTGGVAAVDYYLSSSILEKPGAEEHYTERLVLLNAYATAHEPETKQSATRSELQLPETGSLYFCPHRVAKYHPRFDSYLKRILERDPSGHVLLLTGKHPEISRSLVGRLRGNLGETLMKRVILPPLLPYDHYRRILSVATCVLDSPVYAGDLTTHDAFDYDVPVVTQEGRYLVQRYTAGLCRAMEMESLIADCEEKYVDVAVRLGTDSDYRDAIRRKIGERKEKLFATDATVAEYERFFESVVQ